MKTYLVVISYALILTVILCACSENAGNKKDRTVRIQKPTLEVPSDSFLIKQVETNLMGLTHEDMYYATQSLDLTSPFMVDAQKAIQGSFMVYEMEFRLHNVDIQHKSDTLITAIVEHDSRNHNERTYSPTRSKQRYSWRPVGGEWKIFKMEVLGSSSINY